MEKVRVNIMGKCLCLPDFFTVIQIENSARVLSKAKCQGWRYRSLGEGLPSMCEVLSLIPSTEKEKKMLSASLISELNFPGMKKLFIYKSVVCKYKLESIYNEECIIKSKATFMTSTHCYLTRCH
jgi:hypothetical protein